MAVQTHSASGKTRPHFEFFGPYLGPGGMLFCLPLVLYMLYGMCGRNGCLELVPLSVPPLPTAGLFSWSAFVVYVGWLAFQVLLHLAIPGKKVQGTVLSNGERLTYKFTALYNFWITIALVGVLCFATDTLDLSWVYDNYLPLLTSSVIFTVALSIALYVASIVPRRRGILLAAGGNTGYRLYDFFVGRELNPRIGPLDLKQFCELVPGLLGWLVLDLAMVHRQLKTTGTVSAPLALVCAFQGLYVWDAVQYEPAILTTMDITSDGFGFMLAFGDMSWVPFSYSLQARLLVDRGPVLSIPAVVALVVLKGVGYAMFRGSNSQKDAFRRDPTAPAVAHLRSMPTARGTRLLVSGWWGLSRHPNYLGDWIMAWAWCLPTGTSSGILPYFYVIYFAALLVHRAQRDDHVCRGKYGSDWAKYCRLVPNKIVPYLY